MRNLNNLNVFQVPHVVESTFNVNAKTMFIVSYQYTIYFPRFNKHLYVLQERRIF